MFKTYDKAEITVPLVTSLIEQQFPKLAHLSIKPVEVSGHDNRTFRLGSDMLVRLPSAACYAAKVAIEQKWLPILARHLSFVIPQPLAMGQPSKDYPFHWSVYQWIEGKSANNITIDEKDLPQLAISLAQFLNELHNIDITDAPIAGTHNFWRGGSLKMYDQETRSLIEQLKDVIDVDAVTTVWQKAISCEWNKNPVWIHGDLSAGNILLKDKALVAIIDFGGMSVGDPACDLTIAWTFLTQDSRKLFKVHLQGMDNDTWARARGWALWKALFTLAPLQDKSCSEAIMQMQIIADVAYEHKAENL